MHSPPRRQARGQPFERVQLASSEDASGAVPALALAGPDGWRYCLVEGEASEEERAAATLGAAGAAQAAVGGVAAQGAAAMEE